MSVCVCEFVCICLIVSMFMFERAIQHLCACGSFVPFFGLCLVFCFFFVVIFSEHILKCLRSRPCVATRS